MASRSQPLRFAKRRHSPDSALPATRDDIRRQFEQSVPPLTNSSEYQQALLLFNIGLVAIPVALMLLVLGVVLFSIFAKIWLCVIPLLFLGFLVMGVALIKPLIAPRFIDRGARIINRTDDPFLYEFVDRLSDALGAPRPARIEFDSDLNASARFEGDIFSLRPEQFVLTLGAPLVRGLDLNQLTGVLAHELGHFTQKSGMRSINLALRISRWFTRAVYERDRWDVMLEIRSQEEDSLLVEFMRFSLMVSRGILFTCLIGVIGLCGYLLRRMEFDADRYEAHLVGAGTFERTARRIAELGFGAGESFKQLARLYRDRKLPDDLAKWMVNRADQLTSDEKDEVRLRFETETTGLFDTHPCDRERVTRVKQEGAPGVWKLNGSNEILFNNLDDLSRISTLETYQAMFGRRLKTQFIRSVDELTAEAELEAENEKRIHARFSSVFHPRRRLRLESELIDDEADLDLRRQDLIVARDQLDRERDGYRKAIATFDRCYQKLLETEEAAAVLRAAQATNDVRFAAFASSRADALNDNLKAREQLERAEKELAPGEGAQARRITAALDLMASGATPNLPDLARREREIVEIMPALQVIGEVMQPSFQLRCYVVGQIAVLKKIEEIGLNAMIIFEILNKSDVMGQQLGRIRERLQMAEYPLAEGDEKMSLADYLLEHVQGNQYLGALEHPVEYCAAAEEFLDRLDRVYLRLVARVADTVAAVEEELGLSELTDLNV